MVNYKVCTLCDRSIVLKVEGQERVSRNGKQFAYFHVPCLAKFQKWLLVIEELGAGEWSR